MLVQLFPGFSEDYSAQDLEEAERDGMPSLHSVMIPFTQYYAGAQQPLYARRMDYLNAAAALTKHTTQQVSQTASE